MTAEEVIYASLIELSKDDLVEMIIDEIDDRLEYIRMSFDVPERISDERLKEYIKDGSIFDRRLDDDWD